MSATRDPARRLRRRRRVARPAPSPRCSARAEIPLDERRSGYADMSRDTKAMQDDDTANPGMLSVLDGEALWQAKAGAAGKRLRRLSRRRRGQHERRRRALSGVRARRSAGRSIWSSASICAARSISRRSPSPTKARSCWRSPPIVAHAVARRADRAAGRPAAAAVPRSRPRAVQSAPGPAQPVLRPMPRRQLGQAARRQHHPAGASDRLSDLPAGMAEPRLVAAAAAQLHDRHARRALCLWRAGVCRHWSFI